MANPVSKANNIVSGSLGSIMVLTKATEALNGSWLELETDIYREPGLLIYHTDHFKIIVYYTQIKTLLYYEAKVITGHAQGGYIMQSKNIAT
jgi:hypothetical protein